MDERAAGLCGRCGHCRVVVNARGTAFFLCELAASDARFRKYPRLPVVRCAGFVPRPDGAQGHENGAT